MQSDTKLQLFYLTESMFERKGFRVSGIRLICDRWHVSRGVYCRAMATTIEILGVEQDGKDGLIVTFSDGTIGAYVVDELLELRPIRELAHQPGEHKTPQIET